MNVFIDGSAGTTGLRIRERLSDRADLTLLALPEEARKDPAARRDCFLLADVIFLCLPDAAAIEAVSLMEGVKGVVIDTSTAHRVAPGWTYGLPELPGQKEKIAAAPFIANPGCHATGFISLAAPLVAAGIVPADLPLSCFSLTGYTGGGKKMIAQYEEEGRDPLLDAPRQYGLTQKHKHLPEMAVYAGLSVSPAFCPIVADFPCGMEVTIPLFASQLKGTKADIEAVYAAAYAGPVIRYTEAADEGGFLSASALAGKDGLEVSVAGNEERILVTARFDNLGKGASGAAIQNMNLALGVPETTGLVL